MDGNGNGKIAFPFPVPSSRSGKNIIFLVPDRHERERENGLCHSFSGKKLFFPLRENDVFPFPIGMDGNGNGKI